jgi:hypothetical protein
MKHRERLLIGMLLLTILINMTSSASAYSYSGYKWGGTYVVPKLDTTVPSSWSSAIQAGSTAWNNAGAAFTFKWGMATTTDNRIYCTDAGTRYLGLSVPTHIGNYNTRYVTYFNTHYSWSTASNGESGKFDVQSVSAHEFGHWLTLYDLYNSTDSDKTMYEWTSSNEIKKRTLDPDDIAGIKYIYP